MSNNISLLTNIKIRKTSWTDLADIISLLDSNGYLYNHNDIADWLKGILFLPNFYSIVAETNNMVVGCLILEKTFTFEIAEDYTRIVVLGVNLNYQKQGIGDTFMKEAEKWAIEQKSKGILILPRLIEKEKSSSAYLENHGFKLQSLGYLKKI